MADDLKEQKPAGKGTALIDGVLKEVKGLKDKALDDVQSLKKPQRTQLYKSIFRVTHDEKPRNRALGILSNVFLHLHPAKINRDAVAYNYTWGMGGDHLLSVHRADLHRRPADVLLPPHQGSGLPGHSLPGTRCPFWEALAKYAPLGRPLDDYHGLAAHVQGLSDGLLQEAAGIQLDGGRDSDASHHAAFLYRVPAAG